MSTHLPTAAEEMAVYRQHGAQIIAAVHETWESHEVEHDGQICDHIANEVGRLVVRLLTTSAADHPTPTPSHATDAQAKEDQ